MIDSGATRITTISSKRYDGQRNFQKTQRQFANNSSRPTTKLFTTRLPQTFNVHSIIDTGSTSLKGHANCNFARATRTVRRSFERWRQLRKPQ